MPSLLPQFLHHYRINHKDTPQLGRLLARIFAPVVLGPDDIDAEFQTEVSFHHPAYVDNGQLYPSCAG